MYIQLGNRIKKLFESYEIWNDLKKCVKILAYVQKMQWMSENII